MSYRTIPHRSRTEAVKVLSPRSLYITKVTSRVTTYIIAKFAKTT